MIIGLVLAARHNTNPPDEGFIYRFGTFEVNLASRQLRKAGREIHLQEQPLRLLLLLLERPGELYTRADLQKRLWPNETFVEFDDGLNTAIQKIRQVLGDDARNPRFVETVPRQGYRFIAPVRLEPLTPAALAARLPSDQAELPPSPPPPDRLPSFAPSKRPFVWAAVALAAGAAIGLSLRRPREAPSNWPMRLSITPPPGVELRHGIRGGSAISPDGRSIVFAAIRDGKPQLWLRHLNSLDARPLPGTEYGVLPFWSPDGRSIGFQAAGKLRRISLSGGPASDLAAATRPTRGGWTENGQILFAAGAGGPILRVSASGGTPSPVTPDQRGGASWPVPVPGTGRFLYFENSSRKIQYLPVSGGTQPPHTLLTAESSVIFAPPFGGFPAHLLWLKGTTLVAQAFDPATGKLHGEAVPVAEGVGFADKWRLVDLSVSSNGVLAFGPGNTVRTRLAWVRRDGTILEYVGDEDWLRAVRLSADGRQALIERGNPRALWIFDFERSVLTRATFEQELRGWPVWSPDGSRIAYSGEKDDRISLYGRNAKGGRPETLIHQSSFDDYLYDWSRDGNYLIYCEVNPQTRLDLWLLPLAGDRKPRPFLKTPFNEDWPQFSPDGRWVAYVSDESGRNEVYVTSFPNAEGKWQISTEGGSMPRWAANGEIFFESASARIMAARTRTRGNRIEWSSPRSLFPNPSPGRIFDAAPQGNRFLMMTPVAGAIRNEITVVVNWQAALAK